MYSEPNDLITFNLEWPWKVKCKVTQISKPISCKGAELGRMLLLNINSKAYMGSQMTLSHLTLSDPESSNSWSLTFQCLISCKGAELGHMLLLNINGKACKESPMTSSHLTLSDLQRSNSRSLTFWSLLYHKGVELGHMLVLNINRRAHKESPMTSHLTLNDLQRSKSRSLTFRSLISCKGAELGHMLLFNINRKAYIGSPNGNATVTFDPGWPWKVKVRVTQISKVYISYSSWVRPLLLNINRKPCMGSPVTLSHLTLLDPERSKLRCRIRSKIDTCITCINFISYSTPYSEVLYESSDFNWFSLQKCVFDTSLQKIAIVIPIAGVKQSAKVIGPLVLFRSLVQKCT